MMADKSKITSLKGKRMLDGNMSSEQAVKGNKLKKSDVDMPKSMGEKRTMLKARKVK